MEVLEEQVAEAVRLALKEGLELALIRCVAEVVGLVLTEGLAEVAAEAVISAVTEGLTDPLLLEEGIAEAMKVGLTEGRLGTLSLPLEEGVSEAEGLPLRERDLNKL